MLITYATSTANFTELFQPYWAADHIEAGEGGEPLQLKLDNTSGCGFKSVNKYLFGQVGMHVKLVQGDSAGTVTAFYMSAEGPNHDELDFEFLGNVSGEPYLVQTNVYVNGSGNREQRHSLWFDPTTDFHYYSLLWNSHHVRFMVDGIPIRVFANREDVGVPYPKEQAMAIYASVWNADDWATQGGRVKTNWTHAPFVTSFRSFVIDACADDPVVAKCREEDGPAMVGLSPHEKRQLRWTQRRHLVYDYCADVGRFETLPRECLG
ncbi:Xyloglucan endotransglucosylase/hydrolase protein 9 [Acorus calamus]|uniref:Xyloglucan endotransglucosylase/hydrolase n=2 Tax=Acorus TaxID=4464 RepID=A0AAV9F4Z5_ACOCL|nr:Xyloglucan endotransglucosylase/hydrolase protein 9 [Acorus calamus]